MLIKDFIFIFFFKSYSLRVKERINFRSLWVQRAVLEPAMQGRDMIGRARTGTGKTLAFGIPIMDKIIQYNEKHGFVLLDYNYFVSSCFEHLMLKVTYFF